MTGPEHGEAVRPTPAEAGDRDQTPERPEQDRPKIYVASLTDYNNGRLHGAWIDAGQPPSDIHQRIQEMLARSRYHGAEEWAIHDYEGFGPVRLSEYQSIEHVALIGQGIREHGPAFAAWAAHLDESEWEDRLDDFEDCYLGCFASLEELGTEMADESSVEALLDEHLPEHVRPYVHVDYEAYGRDLAGPLEQVRGDEGIYLFST